jgi:muramoyltetrapeptide carboxypeptidase
LPFLDFDIIKKNPKIIIGYSDMTALVNAINVKTGIVTYHGPLGANLNDSFSIDSMINALFANKSTKIKFAKKNIISNGNVKGRITGGNLSMITSTIGTPYEIDTKNSILFIEETSEEPYKIDKMLTHLQLSGKLDDAIGYIFGYFKNMDARKNFFPGMSFTVRQILEQRFSKSSKPCLIEMPIGHTKNNMTIPLGSMAEINTGKLYFDIVGDFIKKEINN